MSGELYGDELRLEVKFLQAELSAAKRALDTCDRGRAEARKAARVLAHAWDHDARPPDWALELARGWDAHGRPISQATTEPPPSSAEGVAS